MIRYVVDEGGLIDPRGGCDPTSIGDLDVTDCLRLVVERRLVRLPGDIRRCSPQQWLH